MTEEPLISSTSSGFVQNQVAGSNPPTAKRKRNLPGTPDPEADVIALSPKTLMATNRFLCEICGKGFQRDQNLQLHRRGHNLPWKLKQRTTTEIKKRVYVCPEKTCIHHHPSRALGDLTGIKKHFFRKHGEKKWKCDKCLKRYAVQSDWKAHSKTCGTREYKCDCGTLFSRRDSFITHRAFCDALAEETERVNAASSLCNQTGGINYQYFMGAANPINPNVTHHHYSPLFKPISPGDQTLDQTRRGISLWMSQTHEATADGLFGHDALLDVQGSNPIPSYYNQQLCWPLFGAKLSSSGENQNEGITSTMTASLPLANVKGSLNSSQLQQLVSVPSMFSTQQDHSNYQTTSSWANMSATALLQKAAQMGATWTDPAFFGTFGLKNSDHNINNVQEGNKLFQGLYDSSPVGGDFEHELENSARDDLVIGNTNHHHQLQMCPAAKLQKVTKGNEDSTGGGQTRDFLGIEVQANICHQPSSINGWM